MIVSAAIKQNERVFSGRRHADVIRIMVEEYDVKPPVRGVQGFLTDNGEFLTRIEAGNHAIECNQIAKLRWPPNLYSEDLY